MMHVGICDDEHYYQEAICSAINEWISLSGHQDISISLFSSSEDLIESWEAHLPMNLLFLDIQIPNELNGMEIARKIREHDQNISIVFVTNYDNYVYEGYTINALRYLKKPIQNNDIYTCMDIAYYRFSLLMKDGIVIETKNQCLALRYSEICYIEVRSHFVYIFLTNSTNVPQVRTRFGQFITQLPSELFIQCHRSYAVNLLHIRRFTKNSVTLSDRQVLPVSNAYFPHLSRAFKNYYLEGHI